eukprot:Hpha_TRINITY_DN254_c0_g1::TRINITY_DN254_c0_g1_i1::g.83552::m.83552
MGEYYISSVSHSRLLGVFAGLTLCFFAIFVDTAIAFFALADSSCHAKHPLKDCLCSHPSKEPVVLLVADLHINSICPASDPYMSGLVAAARRRWNVTYTLVLGDVLDWGGGSWNLGQVSNLSEVQGNRQHQNVTTASSWQRHMRRFDAVLNCDGLHRCSVIPGNHDIFDPARPFPRWIKTFGSLFGTQLRLKRPPVSIAFTDLGIEGQLPDENVDVVVTHWPIYTSKKKLPASTVISAHRHYTEEVQAMHAGKSVRHVVIPTLNHGYAVLKEKHGQHGLAVLSAGGRVDVCVVPLSWRGRWLILILVSSLTVLVLMFQYVSRRAAILYTLVSLTAAATLLHLVGPPTVSTSAGMTFLTGVVTGVLFFDPIDLFSAAGGADDEEEKGAEAQEEVVDGENPRWREGATARVTVYTGPDLEAGGSGGKHHSPSVGGGRSNLRGR